MTSPAVSVAAGFFEGIAMSKIAMVALKEHRYGGRLLKPGDRFETAGKSHARLLHAVKNADYAPAPPAIVAKPPVAPVVAPAKVAPPVEALAEKPTAAPAVEPPKPPTTPAHTAAPESEEAAAARVKRQYRRRDMTAEGSEG